MTLRRLATSYAALALWPVAGWLFLRGVAGGCQEVPRIEARESGAGQTQLELVTPLLRLRAQPAERWTPLQGLPEELLRAVVYQEDRAFWRHRGYSLREMTIVAWETIVLQRRPRGASTLTQQLARTLFLSRRRVLWRKLREIRIATLLERSLSKPKLLELYLNHVYFGRNQIGITSAARHYFGKRPARLTTPEVAYLVSLLPSPDACPLRVPCRTGGHRFRYRRLLRVLAR